MRQFGHNFYSTRRERLSLYLQRALDSRKSFGDELPGRAELSIIADYFRNVPWTALLVPSRDVGETNNLFTDSHVLEELVEIRPSDPGLILQLDYMPPGDFALDNVFPAFKVALANATRWPGVLIWSAFEDSVFLSVERSELNPIRQLRWIFSNLSTMPGVPNLELLKNQNVREFGPRNVSRRKPLQIIHLSDLHIGSKTARRRMGRIKQLISSVSDELGDDALTVPVVTGDIMDTPKKSNFDDVQTFLDFLHNVGTQDAITVIGNHDVRRDGWLMPDYRQALRFDQKKLTWIEEANVGLLSVNSVRKGSLARGKIGEREFLDLGAAIDRERKRRGSGIIVALLHHHPIPVDVPDWYHKNWYERLLGGSFAKTEALEDSDQFIEFLKTRGIRAVLHGHKHIPRADEHEGIAIIDCGSTVGKVETKEEGTTYISMNVITVDTETNKLTCRMRAERIPGGGFAASASHEVVFRQSV